MGVFAFGGGCVWLLLLFLLVVMTMGCVGGVVPEVAGGGDGGYEGDGIGGDVYM